MHVRVLTISECYPALGRTLRQLLPRHAIDAGGSGACATDCAACNVIAFIGYESRMEHEDAFFESLEVRDDARRWVPTSSLTFCHRPFCDCQVDFALNWFDVPEYNVGLRQPESFGVCSVMRRRTELTGATRDYRAL